MPRVAPDCRPDADTGSIRETKAVVLAAAQRLRRSSDFAAAIRGGRRAARGTLVVHLKSGDPGTTHDVEPARSADVEYVSTSPRAGFVVSKAVGNAVVRNRVRRRLRHLVRERLGELGPGASLVVRALPAAADVPYPRLGADLDAALAAARSDRGRARRPR